MRETISHAPPFFSLSEVGKGEVGALFCCSICCVGEEGRVIFCLQGVVTNLYPEIDSIPHHVGIGQGFDLLIV